ncbi:MAG: helix-hairpin-helix domain-containing protein [Candidatus Marinimicrobia bacterium]|nr:helix-hairpin-helix domain-containing protein [Candidatus Neomarinimicrobiota bacterium]
METGKEEKNIEKNNKTNNKYSQSEKKQKKDIAIFKKININTGNLEELEKISYIGPSKARKIIEYRNANGNFKSLREIINVKGIGEKTFEKIKEQIEI